MRWFYLGQFGKQRKGKWAGAVSVSAVLFLWTILSWAEPVMVEKNLFSPERSPVEEEPEATPEEQQKTVFPAGQIQLDGIFIHGEVKKAILRVNPRLLMDKNDSRQKKAEPFVTVKEGEQLGDFQIKTVEPRGIRVSYKGNDYEVPLFAQGKVASQPVPALPPPPVPQAQGPGAGQGGVPLQVDAQGNPVQGAPGIPNNAGTGAPPSVPSTSPSAPPAPPSVPSDSNAPPSVPSAATPATPTSSPPAPSTNPASSAQQGSSAAAATPTTTNSTPQSSQTLVPPGVNLFDQMRKAIDDARQKGLIQ